MSNISMAAVKKKKSWFVTACSNILSVRFSSFDVCPCLLLAEMDQARRQGVGDVRKWLYV